MSIAESTQTILKISCTCVENLDQLTHSHLCTQHTPGCAESRRLPLCYFPKQENQNASIMLKLCNNYKNHGLGGLSDFSAAYLGKENMGHTSLCS